MVRTEPLVWRVGSYSTPGIDVPASGRWLVPDFGLTAEAASGALGPDVTEPYWRGRQPEGKPWVSVKIWQM